MFHTLPLKKIFLSLLLIGTFLLPSITPTFAAGKEKTTTNLVNPIGGDAKENPKGKTNIPELVGDAIRIALGIMGSITLLVFIYGGFQFLTSAGNSDKVQTGTNAMLYATIGLFIIFGAYAILSTIISGIAKDDGMATTREPIITPGTPIVTPE